MSDNKVHMFIIVMCVALNLNLQEKTVRDNKLVNVEEF